MAKCKVLIIGAGNIGKVIANMLLPYYKVTLTDSNPQALENPLAIESNAKNITTQVLDINDLDALHKILQNHDYVINAGPYFIASHIATAAAATATHYFDLTEDVHETSLIKVLDNGKLKSALVPQCGLAPGFISIAANNMAQQFDVVYDIKMRVGALPLHPTNKLKYSTTWSIDGLINEYFHSCNAIKDHRYVTVDALDDYETFVLDGTHYEAFNTSGGLGSMCSTWASKAKSLNYKSIRYPGHHHLVDFLINDMKLSSSDLISMFKKAVPVTKQDIVLIFIEVTGLIDSQYVSTTLVKKIYNNNFWSAIQLTTATGIAVMVEAHRQGLLPQTGFVKQEDLSLEDFCKIDRTKFWNTYKGYKG